MQTVKPTKIIISVDGPVEKVLSDLIDEFSSFKNVMVVTSAVNRGAGHARALAIKHSLSSYVALMDSDDIAVFDRFEKQLDFITRSKADVVGGLIDEFDVAPGDSNRKRIVPLDHHDIKQKLKWQQSMNNVTLYLRETLTIM